MEFGNGHVAYSLQTIFRCLPDGRRADIVVAMHDDIAQTGHFSPWHVRMTLFQIVGQALGVLSNHAQPVRRRVYGFIRPTETLCRLPVHRMVNALNKLKDNLQLVLDPVPFRSVHQKI